MKYWSTHANHPRTMNGLALLLDYGNASFSRKKKAKPSRNINKSTKKSDTIIRVTLRGFFSHAMTQALRDRFSEENRDNSTWIRIRSDFREDGHGVRPIVEKNEDNGSLEPAITVSQRKRALTTSEFCMNRATDRCT